MVKFEQHMRDLEPQHMDYRELFRSTKAHIKGLKLQLEVAYGALDTAEAGLSRTKKPDEETCESTKTEDTDTNSTKK